jgi:hypothetical protein
MGSIVNTFDEGSLAAAGELLRHVTLAGDKGDDVVVLTWEDVGQRFEDLPVAEAPRLLVPEAAQTQSVRMRFR